MNVALPVVDEGLGEDAVLARVAFEAGGGLGVAVVDVVRARRPIRQDRRIPHHHVGQTHGGLRRLRGSRCR